MSKKSAPERITLTFDLHDLPTAQHRAGLAGLILQIDSMGSDGNRRNPKLIPAIELTPTSATITFTRESMQGVFDDAYAAKPDEATVTSKWPKAKLKREITIEKKDSKTGEMKPVRAFVYDIVLPLAPCLQRHIQPQARSWLTLWRQMVWEIPRGGNNVRSRAPFNETAGGKPCGEGSKAWTQINKFLEKRAKSQFETEQISGALLLGAQAVNAEGVPFSGRVDHNLLLHFWQVVVLTFIPRVVDKKDGKTKRVGYVLAIPDVANLVRGHRTMLGNLA
jgi:CRISPR-associated protein Cmx8